MGDRGLVSIPIPQSPITHKTNKSLVTFEKNEDNNTVQSGKIGKGLNNTNIKNDNEKNKCSYFYII